MSRSRVIAVACAKGSPGCSFVALGLAGRLAESGLRTLLVDADGEDGSLAGRLDLPPIRIAGPDGGLAPIGEAELEGRAVAAAARLSCLDVSGESAPVEGRQLVEAARSGFPAVVADLGHRPGRLQRELVAAADWLVWVVAPDRAGFERADRVLEAGAYPAVAAGIVLNRLGPDCLPDAGAVLAERHHLPLLARLPAAERGAREAARRLISPHRCRDFQRHFWELARCLHPDLHGGGGAAWP